MLTRLLAVLIISFLSSFSFAAVGGGSCPSSSTLIVGVNPSWPQPKYGQIVASYCSSFMTKCVTVPNGSDQFWNGSSFETSKAILICMLAQPVKCDSSHDLTPGEYAVNYGCEPKCPEGYNKNAQGICVDKNGCTEDKFLKGGQCSDRCSEYGSNASGYNMQTHDCNFNQQCGVMQKRQRYDLSSSTGLGSGACADDPNGCPSGYSWLPSTNGGANACRSTTSNDVNSTCPSGTKIAGDGSTGQCEASGSSNQTASSSTGSSTSGSQSTSSGVIPDSSSSGIPSSTSSGSTSSGANSGGSGSSAGPQTGLSSASSSGSSSTGSTAGSTGSIGSTGSTSTGAIGSSTGSSSGGETGGYSGRCDIPPQCQNSASIECAQLYQTWFAGCPLKGYTHQEFVPKVDDGKAKVRELFDGFKTRVSKAPAIEGFSNFLKFTKTGSCPTWSINLPWFTATFDYLCSPIIPWGVISGVLIACSLLIAFRLAAK